MDAATERELLDFVAHEARLIDARRYDEWLALFADEGRYWVPLMGEAQDEGAAHNALADEDRMLLTLRIERLKSPRAHSQHPPSRCQHVLQQPVLVQADDDAQRYELRTPFVYVESRGERQLMLAGTVRHRLVRRAGSLRIELKRVDLLDAGAALPAIQLFP
ncbi:aromatic-ring-hydroxylating dioxygenase subunit beta [Piscinibacter sp. XHJ-5]|uniref:aromatic-ring-hydroxylating dioxygenase subunit beta n=1 Tax=Piscinibacter sp. XHJ-5 TaxID=3037797 RepID=UPI0024531963|nr:aromatic-ring-hydroxylating dioxygenase subunit beta [Piscinibacter sp. XHJ-5]